MWDKILNYIPAAVVVSFIALVGVLYRARSESRVKTKEIDANSHIKKKEIEALNGVEFSKMYLERLKRVEERLDECQKSHESCSEENRLLNVKVKALQTRVDELEAELDTHTEKGERNEN